ncbi:MAG: hypothetical protein HC893_14330 [Chloroflexaceae bacterium]|nr:hypothetical protein [Chloroflexaceae bacterium]
MPAYSIVSADGEEMQVGWVVPVEHAERLQEHRLVMTTQGYMLADDNGRIIHTFK